MYEILIYQTNSGKEPYTEWNISLDTIAAARIDARLTKIRETGNFGVCEPVGDGVFELKFDFGPGYRVYFAYKAKSCLILLYGGDKKSQKRDINRAKQYWLDHLSVKGGKHEKI